MLRLLISSLLLLAVLACPEEAVQMLPPFPGGVLRPSSAGVPAAPFQVEPYLQLGAGPASPDRLTLLWHAQDGPGDWAVEIKPQSGEDWTRMAPPVSVLVDQPGAAPHRVWSAALTPLGPGLPFEYRVLLDGNEVFQTEGKALKGPGQPQEVVVAGDLAGGDPQGGSTMVRLIHQRNPDLMVAAGSLVPPPDSLQQYRRSLFSIYNAGPTDPKSGAPFMRSTVLVSVRDPGPAGRLAYRTYWDQPQAGPERWAGQVHGGAAPEDAPAPQGSFDFRAGDAHWTVLDAGPGSWNEPARQAWLARELAAAQSARWRFVVLPRPARGGADTLRTVWPLFRKYRVAIVFTGHQPLLGDGPEPPRPTPAPRAPGFSRLEISASRVVCEQVDGRGGSFGRFILSQ